MDDVIKEQFSTTLPEPIHVRKGQAVLPVGREISVTVIVWAEVNHI